MDQSTDEFALHPEARMMAVEPILEVRDVQAATSFYRDILDFEHVWLWGDPPSHGGANRDHAALQFSLNPELAAHADGRCVWLRVHHVAALYARHMERGAEIVSPLEPKPWGFSEYTVRDLNGYLLRFAGIVAAEGASDDLPADVRIELRMPTWPEMEALIHAVGWDDYTNFETAPRALQTAHVGVVATVDGLAIGSALASGDNAGFFYIRDVMVHPDWQRKRVGTALMQTLMAEVRAKAPAHSIVGLFTGSNLHEFYARFGFRGPTAGLYGMTIRIP